MNQNYEKLKSLLKELFQLDQPDLDFGLYRVMHAKSDEVTQFLEKDLLPQVREALEQYKSKDKIEIEKDLNTAIEQAKGLGVDPETTQKVKDLRDLLKTDAVDLGGLESEVYDHLYSFFRRYYSEGDFLAKRVYKPGVYAIPYEGEEVTLHWANKDQYYIKTSEYLRDYAFQLKPGDEKNPLRVHLRLLDADEGEYSNGTTAEGKDRVFILSAPGDSGRDFIVEEHSGRSNELVFYFEYRSTSLNDWPEDERDDKKKPPVQQDLTAMAVKRVLAVSDTAFMEWITELGKPHVLANGTQADYTRLEAHLRRYTARNSYDYFIHKDLGGFLRRELDFYIKNEVLHLDDVENVTVPRVEQYLSKIKVIRNIAGKIIDFLAQLEDFQRKLWLKKKFVVETQYCIVVDAIPEEYYPEIVANEAQHEEWIKLFAIDEIRGDSNTPGYSMNLTPEFLKANPTLVLDTQYFDEDFVERLLDSVGNMSDYTDGVLIHGENLQALSLMNARYFGQIECVHVDPPYNTQTSGFLYRNSYQHSSWLAMMAERLDATRRLLRDSGALLCHIDENEYERLHLLCQELQLPNAGTVVWDKQNPMLGRRGVATQHEYVLWRTQATGPLYLRNANQKLILQNAERIIKSHNGVTDDARKEFARWVATCPELTGGERAYKMLDDDGRVFRGVAMGAPEKRLDPKFHIPLIHPITGKSCPVPPNGWSRTPGTLEDLLNKGKILFGKDETVQPQLKVFLTHNSRRQVSSVIRDTGRGKTDMDKLGLEFPYCHPLSLYIKLVGAAAPNDDDIVLDCFAGSGTNGHAVIALNRDEGKRRRLILIEVGEQFDSVLVPRIKKATFSTEWAAGRPQRRPLSDEVSYSPRIIKVLRLESYDDALNNLETLRTEKQRLLLDAPEAQGEDGLREQYMLRYMLDVETRNSQSLLNVRAFTDPASYRLKVNRAGSDESRDVKVDLLETFNWLIGLEVRHIAVPQTFSATFERDSENRLRLKERLKQEAEGPYWFRTVTGTTPDGRRTLVIWRKLSDTQEEDNLVLEEWFTRQGYSSRDSEFDIIYVNGGNNLENLKTSDDLWKVRLIEEDFHRLMFEVEGE